MPRFFLFFLLLMLSTASLFAQKIKVKKGKIYINKVEMYRIAESGKYDKAIISVEHNDTLVWMKRRTLINDQASYETEQKALNYIELTFARTEFKFNFISKTKDDLYKSLLYTRAISNQTVYEERLESFGHNTFAHGLEVLLLEQAIAQREKLLDNIAYQNYAKHNGLRSPNAELWISNNMVLSKTLEDGTPTGLGRIEQFNENGMHGYRVFRNADQKLIATIEFDFRPFTMTINSVFDQASVSHVLQGGEQQQFMLLALQYLTDSGYL